MDVEHVEVIFMEQRSWKELLLMRKQWIMEEDPWRRKAYGRNVVVMVN